MASPQLTPIRSDPGIIIFNLKKQITFANSIAWSLLNGDSQGDTGRFAVPDELLEVYHELNGRLERFAWNSCPEAVYLKKAISIGKAFFAVRGFIIEKA